MSTDAQAMLAEILAGAENPAELLQAAANAALSNTQDSQQRLNLLVASDPNIATYMRSSMPPSVNAHQRYVPTVEVVFKDGSWGGEAVTINKDEFDADLHELPEAEGEEKKSRSRSRAPSK